MGLKSIEKTCNRRVAFHTAEKKMSSIYFTNHESQQETQRLIAQDGVYTAAVGGFMPEQQHFDQFKDVRSRTMARVRSITATLHLHWWARFVPGD